MNGILVTLYTVYFLPLLGIEPRLFRRITSSNRGFFIYTHVLIIICKKFLNARNRYFVYPHVISALLITSGR